MPDSTDAQIAAAAQVLLVAALRLMPSAKHMEGWVDDSALVNLNTTMGALRQFAAAVRTAAPIIRATMPAPVEIPTEGP